MEQSSTGNSKETTSQAIQNFFKDAGNTIFNAELSFPDLEEYPELRSRDTAPNPITTGSRVVDRAPKESEARSPSINGSYPQDFGRGSSEIDLNEFERRLRIYDDILYDELRSTLKSRSSMLSSPRFGLDYEADDPSELASSPAPKAFDRNMTGGFQLPMKSPLRSRGTISRALSVHSTPKSAEHPLITGNTSAKNTTSRFAPKLSAVDWDYLRDICSFFDRELNEDVTADSSLDMEEVRRATTALNLPEPHGPLLEMLLRAGLNVYRYSDTARPWSHSLNALEHDLSTQDHAEFLAQRRGGQEELATALFRHKTLRTYLAIWRGAYYDDVLCTQELLHFLDVKWLLPDYLETWRRRTDMVQRVEKQADIANKKRTLSTVVDKIRHQAALYEGRQEYAGELLRSLTLRKTIRLWKAEVKRAENLRGLADAQSSRQSRLNILTSWRRKRWEKVAGELEQRIVLKSSFDLLRYKDSQSKSSQRHALAVVTRLTEKKTLTTWKQRLSLVNDLKARPADKGRAIVNLQLQTGYFKHWSHEALVSQERKRLRKRFGLVLLRNWKRESYLSVYKKALDKRVATLYLRYWQHSFANVGRQYEAAQGIQASRENSVMRASFQGLKESLSNIRQLETKEVTARELLLRQTALDMILRSIKALQARDRQSRTLREFLLKRNTLTRIAQCSEELRDRRLELAETDSRRRVDALVKLNLFRIWRHKTRTQKHRYDTLVAFTNHGVSTELLGRWKDLLYSLDVASAIAAEHLSRRYLSKSLTTWKLAAREREELAEAASDLDVGRLAYKFKTELRAWHRATIFNMAKEMQAERYLEQRTRSLFLSTLQNWRERVSDVQQSSTYYETVGDLNSPDHSRGLAQEEAFPRNSYGEGPALKLPTPRKLFPMSPRALQKWKNNEMSARNSPATFSSSSPIKKMPSVHPLKTTNQAPPPAWTLTRTAATTSTPTRQPKNRE